MPSLNSEYDWDRSLPETKDNAPTTTPRSPVNETCKSPRYTHSSDGKGNTLSELLRLHAEKDSKGNFSAEEATKIADVLGQWVGVNSCSVLKLDPDPL
jgi:hypothetical protein